MSVKLDIVSSDVVEIAPNSQTEIDIDFQELRHITGAEYFKQGGNFEDTLTFQVVHPVAGVVDQFATDIKMKDSSSYGFYKATIIAGLTARAIYKNNGNQAAKFAFNLICHKDKP